MMIEVNDRIPTYPGRVKMIPVAGQANTYDMVRADDPIQVGTPLNKALFDSMQSYIYDAVQAISNKVFEFSQWAELSSLPDGTSFGLYENGVFTQYIKLKNNYEESGRPLVLRRHITHQAVLHHAEVSDYAKVGNYGETPLDAWLNSDFLSRFDAATQAAITEVTIEVADEEDTKGQINRRVFLLSLNEYNASMSYVTKLGDPVTVFNGYDSRVALYNGVPVAHHTRSCDTYFDDSCIVMATGDIDQLNPNETAGVRPAFTLPADFQVVVAVYSTANIMATSEVIE